MIQRLLAGGLIAGFAAGLFAALLHFAFIQELILLGEEYETGALVHFGGTGEAAEAAGHDHAEGEPAHDDGAAAEEGETSAATRNALTVLFTGLIYASYGLILVAGFALAEHFGRRVEARDGIFWGLAGFAALMLAPAMGLAPELPGSVAAELGARQAWWLGTVVATAGGLALLAFGRGFVPALIGGALLAGPHLIGAPHPEGFFGVAPPEVAGEYSARVLGVGFFAWAALGWLAARLWTRDA
ncbi:CbtA family protein [Defluviimonas salinarum]|uniref:CbtA family protein n=1 Tax=Defluviimonas salinarum TaxID=2992147 RepID=A0ABT3J2U2_9RHOB|nr:CbtA family protein [Defluviimonas salinarum]MCW3782003.1 CbtA family protein [Defluviimonas salinarum]